MKSLLSRLLFILFIPFALHADSLTVEGDLNIEGSLRIIPQTVPDIVSTGMMYFDLSTGELIVYNGEKWISLTETATIINTSGGIYSLSLGKDSSASGGRAIAIGADAIASGNSSIAIGQYANAGASNAIALGYHATASGNYATAWGAGPEASGVAATAWGWTTEASGDYSTAFGQNTAASGDYSATWGNYSEASGDYSTAWGEWGRAIGDFATAWGAATYAIGDYSTAWGHRTHAESYSSSALGCWNIGGYTYSDDGVDTNDGDTQWFDLDPLLEVGNGDYSARSNALTVIKNGQTTLENKYWDEEMPTAIPADPDTALNGDQSSAGEALVVKGHTNLNGNLTVQGNVSMPRQGDIWMGAFGNPEDSWQQSGS